MFTDVNLDAKDMNSVWTNARRKTAQKVTRDSQDYYRYEMCMSLNIGLGLIIAIIMIILIFLLARQDIPLPTGVPITICFNRALATKSLLQIIKRPSGATKDAEYPDKIVTIISPVLACYFVESEKAEALYSKAKIYDISVDYFDYNIRRELLMDKISEHNLKLFEGPLPSSLVIGLMEPDRFDGSFDKSSFKFKSHDLEFIDVQVDNLSISSFPMKMKSGNAIEFYLNYLKATNRYENVFANGALTYENFVNSNFLIYIDLRKEKLTNGQLVVKLKFNALLPDKLYLLFMPVYPKSVTYDSYFNATVTTHN